MDSWNIYWRSWCCFHKPIQIPFHHRSSSLLFPFFSSSLSLKPFCASHFYVYEIKIIKEILCIHTDKWNDCVSVFVTNKVRIVIWFSTYDFIIGIWNSYFLVYNAILHNINYVKRRMKNTFFDGIIVINMVFFHQNGWRQFRFLLYMTKIFFFAPASYVTNTVYVNQMVFYHSRC